MSKDKYIRPTNIKPKEFCDATHALLANLFFDSAFREDEKLFYHCLCRNSIEDFIDGEIFTEGAIKLILPDNTPDNRKPFYLFAAVYFLHCRFNAKLKRGTYEQCNMEAFDRFLHDALCYSAWLNYPNWKQRDKFFFNANNFLGKLNKLAFRFVSPTGIRCIWRGSKYSSKDSTCHVIDMFVDRDSFYSSYDDYIAFLLTKERNTIADFESLRDFWEAVVKLGRSNDPHRMEDARIADIDLMLLCLALGFDEKVYDKLIDLRDKKHANRNLVNPRTPVLGIDEPNYIKSLLNQSRNRLATARSAVTNLEDIPRRMLLDANIALMAKGFESIIS